MLYIDKFIDLLTFHVANVVRFASVNDI